MIDGEATFAGVGLPRRRAADAGMIGHVSISIPAVAMSSPCGDSSGPALCTLGRRPNYSRGRVWLGLRCLLADFPVCRSRPPNIAAAPDGGNRGCLNSLSRQPGSDTAQDFAKTFELLRFVGLRHAPNVGECECEILGRTTRVKVAEHRA